MNGKVARWVGGALLVVVIIVMMGVRLANPDMTETRLLLTYWWLWLIIIAVMLLTLWLFSRYER